MSLASFTPRGSERFLLPALAPPLTVVEARVIREVPTRFDTVFIEPARRRLSVVARAVYAPRDVQALGYQAFMGPLTEAQRRTLRKGTLGALATS